MKKFLLFAIFGTIALAAAPATFHPKIQVKKVANMSPETAIDHPVWKNTPSYQFMRLIYNMTDMYRKPAEPASVQYLFDDNYLYVRAELTDSDVMTTGTVDGTHLYVMGDLLEIFIKPENANYYWEIYGTPNQLQTRFYFGSRATVGLPSGFTHQDVGIKVFSKIHGTFNDPTDRDKGCTTLVAIPVSELNRPHLTKDHPAGTVPFEPGNAWRIQSARYNYSCHMNALELSSCPQTYGGYHSLEYFAEMELIK